MQQDAAPTGCTAYVVRGGEGLANFVGPQVGGGAVADRMEGQGLEGRGVAAQLRAPAEEECGGADSPSANRLS